MTPWFDGADFAEILSNLPKLLPDNAFFVGLSPILLAFDNPKTVFFCQDAPLAQLDRATDFESVGREFESLRARHF
jgi:hypothetical protein